LRAKAGGMRHGCQEDRCGTGEADVERHYFLFPLDARGCLKYLNKLKAQDGALD
jgi:hypothetical protein